MARSTHGTLNANVVKSVSVESGRGGIVVVNRAQTGVIWVRIDGIDPVPEGPGTMSVLGARQFPATQRSRQVVTIEVRMITDTPRQYSVEAYG